SYHRVIVVERQLAHARLKIVHDHREMPGHAKEVRVVERVIADAQLERQPPTVSSVAARQAAARSGGMDIPDLIDVVRQEIGPWHRVEPELRHRAGQLVTHGAEHYIAGVMPCGDRGWGQDRRALRRFLLLL